MVRAMHRGQVNDMLMLGLNETIDYLAMAKSVHSHGHIMRRALDFEVDVKGGNAGRKGHGRSQLMKDGCMEFGLCKEDVWSLV